MDFKEVLGLILVPLLLFILNGIKKDIRRLTDRLNDLTSKCNKCKK